MSLRDILKKKDTVKGAETEPPPPEFKFVRSDTYTQEAIQPPNADDPSSKLSPNQNRLSKFRRPSQGSSRSPSSREPSPTQDKDKGERRLSHRLHIGRSSRSASASSVTLPPDLPSVEENNCGDAQEREARWEKRATVLGQGQINLRPSSPQQQPQQQRSRSPSVGRVDDDVRYVLLLSWIPFRDHGHPAWKC